MFSAVLRPFFVFFAASLIATAAFALPAPMSEAKLAAESDVMALVRVMSVTCTSITKDKATGQALHGYLAKLRVLQVKKGDVRPGGELLVTFREVPKNTLGPWTVIYYPGEDVWTHLVKREGGVTYASTWWNAKDEVKPPETKELPTQIGQSVLATAAD